MALVSAIDIVLNRNEIVEGLNPQQMLLLVSC